MEAKRATTYKYNIEDSASRMDGILNTSDDDYEDKKNNIPPREQLTYKNGYYVNVTALFIDIVGSSKLTDGHRRPVLAKMYRAFLSECVAIMNSWEMCKEININGDCVWGVFETPRKSDVGDVTSVAAQLNSMINVLNYKLKKKKYDAISVGIGIDYGLALMVKAGYSGSGINDVVWMGDVVNTACHLANKAGRQGRKKVVVTEKVYGCLNDEDKELFSSFTDDENITRYEGNFVITKIDNWYKENCK